jgi:hypothetical protein
MPGTTNLEEIVSSGERATHLTFSRMDRITYSIIEVYKKRYAFQSHSDSILLELRE